MKKVTIKDVAKLANVSISAVSAALDPSSKKISDAKRKEIFKIIDEIGYVRNVNASGLASKKAKRVGFFLNDVHDFEDAANVKLIYFINYYATKYNLEVINIFANNDENNSGYLLNKINLHNLTDIILFGLSKNDEKLEKINHLDINKIFIDLPITGEKSYFVSIDNYEAQKSLTNHVIGKNNSKILYITGDKDSYVAIERERGFISAAKKAKIEFDVIKGSYDLEDNYNIVKTVDTTKYDAIMCSCDFAMIGVIRYLSEQNIMNKTVAGFDGIHVLSYFTYGGYTIEQHFDLFSKACIEMIVNNEYANKLIDYEIKQFGTTIK